MKFIIVAALALVAVACAAPVEKDVVIVRSDFDQQPDGAYQTNVETSDGTKRIETGELKEVTNEENKPVTVLVVRGAFQYVDPEGKNQEITYFADETGFHAEGEAIPKQVAARR